MPRRNRQKLHRELRLAAEAQKRRRRESRLRRKAESERVTTAVAQALRGAGAGQGPGTPGIRTVARLDAVLTSLRSLLRLARVPSAHIQRVVRLCRALDRNAPELATVDQLPWFVLLADPTWVREPEAWTAPSGSVRRKRDALATWLLARYPVPPFLLRALDVDPLAVARVPVEDQWAVRLLAHVGRGDSVRTLVGTPLLPAPLTRRMVHTLLQAPADRTPVQALRWAQVHGQRGPRRLYTALLNTRLGELRGPDVHVGEPFWHEVIGWLCRTPELHACKPAALDDVLAWIEAMQRQAVAEGRSFELKGRTARAVRAHTAAFHRQRLLATGGDFPSSGLGPLDDEVFEMVELGSRSELEAEGEAMMHCVGSYWRLAKKRKVALFSLRERGERRATVEVALGAGRVVQAKRKANRPITAAERAAIARWAALNRLRLSG